MSEKSKNITSRNVVILVVLAMIVVVYAGQWLRDYLTHIKESNARIEGAVINVSSRLPGWVIRLDKMTGDAIRQGDELLLIDDREARLALQSLDTQAQGLAAQIGDLELQIDMAEGQTVGRVGEASNSLGALRAELKLRQDQLDQAQSDYQRAQGLAADQMISTQQMEHVSHALVSAKEAYAQSEAKLRGGQSSLGVAKATLLQPESLRKKLEVLQSEAQRVAIERQRQSLNVEDRTLRSPFNGVVDKVFVNVGEYVNPGQTLLMIHDPQSIFVEAKIKESAIRWVRLDQAVSIHVDAYPDRVFAGRVAKIGAAATNQFALLPDPNPSGNFTKITQRIPIRIRFDQPYEGLHPGMMVEISIDTRD